MPGASRMPRCAGASGSGNSSLPRPIPTAVPPNKKNGTSLPNCSPMALNLGRSPARPTSTGSANSTAAASLILRAAHGFVAGLELVVTPCHRPVNLLLHPGPGLRLFVVGDLGLGIPGGPELAGVKLGQGVPGEDADRKVRVDLAKDLDNQIQPIVELLQRLAAGEGHSRDPLPAQDPFGEGAVGHLRAALAMVRVRVLAARALQRASLEEDSGPRTGPVDGTAINQSVDYHVS